MILNGRDVVCSCLSGFSGNKTTYLI
jgi:hypothetical protein